LNRLGYPIPIVIVSPDSEYKRDKKLLNDINMFGDLEKLYSLGLCDLYKLENINLSDTISILEDRKCNIGISINCRSIIKKPLIDFFSSVIFNIHGANLPFERGGAGASWKILNKIDDVVSTLHYLTEGIDDGDIILSRREKIDVSKAYPVDILEKSNIASKALISEFLEKVKSNYSFDKVRQNNDESIYLSRLYTKINGAINWNWESDEIERFIRAFGFPYEGAWTYCGTKKIHLIDVDIDNSIEFHPYLSGRVVTVMNDMSVRIVAGSGLIKVSKIRLNSDVVLSGSFLKVGDILHTNNDDLHESRSYKPVTRIMK
jgi:methionyl-tRNA formyltransferase